MDELPSALRTGASRPRSVANSSTYTQRQTHKRYSYALPPTPEAEASNPLSPELASQDTFYNPASEQLQQDNIPSIHQPSRIQSFRSFVGRFGSIRDTALRSNSRYGVLGDAEDERAKGALHNLEELEDENDDDDGEAIGVDITAFGGPIHMRSVKKSKTRRRGDRSRSREPQVDAATAGFMDEYNRLETLGGGMKYIVDRPFRYAGNVREPSVRHKSTSSVNEETRNKAQQAAEEAEEVIAVEVPVDIGQLSGGRDDSNGVLERVVDSAGKTNMSYYFPEDKDMPDWKPFPIQWPYLLFLSTLAMVMGGIQEALCQISILRANQVPPHGLVDFRNAVDISNLAFFTWKYLPTMILVAYGVLWQIADFEVKRLEPYYQLSRKTGATAAESLNMDYLTFLAYFVPFKAIRYRQWAVLFSSCASLMASTLVPALQSAAVQIYPDQDKRHADKLKWVGMDPPWSRALSATLWLVGLCGFALVYKMRRKSGLLSDPKGIAGVAAMATRSHILHDFKNLDVAPNPVIHEQLRHRRYKLHKSSLWQGEFMANKNERYETKPSENPHPAMLRLTCGIPYILCLLTFAALIPVFMFIEHANKVTEALPWLLTLLATLIQIVWNTLECDVRLSEPYFILSNRHAPPATLTMDWTGTVPLWMPIKAAISGHWLLALVGLGAVMTQVLTVCVSSFSVDGSRFISGQGEDGVNDPDARPNSGETFKSFWVSFGLSIGILLSMSLIAALVYYHRRHKFLPRLPGTIASVLALIHQSHMLADFVETERRDSAHRDFDETARMDSAQMTKHLERLRDKKGQKKSYGLGWFNGRDEQDHCGIDQEELLSKYEHGMDFTKGRISGPDHIGTWDYF